MASAQNAGLALVTASAIPGLMGAFLPPLNELAGLGEADAAAVHRAELHGVALAVGLGVGASVLSQSPWPVLVSLGMVAYLLWLYESALHAPVQGEGTTR